MSSVFEDQKLRLRTPLKSNPIILPQRLLVNYASIAYNADMGKKRTKISDQIRAAIDVTPVSRYRIAQETGIDEGTVSRFMAGKAGLSMKALDKLGEYLGLELTQREGN